jgi:HSP20 family protein
MSFMHHPLFSPFVFSVFGGTDPVAPTRSRLDAAPSADVYRRDGMIVLHVDLPGVDRSTLQVTVDGQWLTIAAERLYTPEPGDRVLLSERPFGRFERRFRLADRVDASGVKANLVDGVLTVTLSEEATAPTSVRIDVAGAETPGSQA